MKNIRGILAGVLALAALMVSCVAELDTTPEVDITTVRCTIPRIDVEEDFATGILDTLTATKATFSNSNFLWSAGDKIGIVPNTGAQIYFEVDNGAGTSTASFDGGDWAMKSTGTFYAYYPLYPDIFLSKDHVSVSYTGQTQSGNNNNLHTGDYWTLYTEGTTAVGNALNFSFNHLTSFFKTYVTVPAGTYTKITFSAPTEVFIKNGYFDLSEQTPSIVGTTMTDELCLDLQNVTFADETELTGYLVLAPVDITGVPITVTVYKDGEPAYEYTLTKANPMVAAKTYAFRATALTQLAASAAQANALYAAGATSVSITEPLTEDMAIVLPNTSEAVTLILPTTASTSTLTVSYPPAAESYPTTLSITGPEGADLDIRTPNSTVTVNGIAYDQVISRTAANTCIIPVGVTVNNLKVVQGGVQVYGIVSQIDLSEQEDEAIINVSGTVTSLLGEDDNEYVPATGVTLNKMSINLNSGSTETLIATIAPVGAYPNVVWSSSDDAVATVSAEGVVTAIAEGSATITAKTISGGFVATCEVTVTNGPTIAGKEYVDLGIRKSHLDNRITPGSEYDRKIVFATHNIGANNPEDFGYYFRWGELNGWAINAGLDEGYSYAGEYSFDIISATQYDKNGNAIGSAWSSSTFSDSYALEGRNDLEDFKGKTNLQCNGIVYGDAATYIWGNAWSTPDSYFLESCFSLSNASVQLSNGIKTISIGNGNAKLSLKVSFIEQYGVNGLKIENEALNTSVFIPAGGRCIGGRLCFPKAYNDQGNIMSSSADRKNSADNLFFDSSMIRLSTGATYVARPIRPIAELTLSGNVPDVAVLPSLGNVEIQSVDYRTATVKASLINDGNAITERGFYYGTSLGALNTKIMVSGYNIGEYSRQLSGLSSGTTYYIKAYATNEVGTVESDVVSFTTMATSGTLNGFEWVDIGIRKSQYDNSIEAGSSQDRRIVIAKYNIGTTSFSTPGYFFRGDELYGWKYSGGTTSNTKISGSNLKQVDNNGNTIKTFQYDNFYWSDEDLDFVIEYNTGNAVNYYYGNEWTFIPSALARELYCTSGYFDPLPSRVTKTNTSLNGITLTYLFESKGLTISNQAIGSSVFIPYDGIINGAYYNCYYYPRSATHIWIEGNVEEVYGGGIREALFLYKDSSGYDWDDDREDWTKWKYGWTVIRENEDSYFGAHIRAVAELPL